MGFEVIECLEIPTVGAFPLIICDFWKPYSPALGVLCPPRFLD